MISEICANPLRKRLGGGGISRSTGLTEMIHLSKFAGFRKEFNENILQVIYLCEKVLIWQKITLGTPFYGVI